MHVAICIVTYRRPAQLERLLDCLKTLVFASTPPDVRIVVVDNDPACSAVAVCKRVAQTARWPLDYVAEPQPGIAPARNAAARTVRDWADWIAFVDDDETPEPPWLQELLTVQEVQQADAVAGPVLPRFEPTAPDWLARSGLFERPRRPTGTIVAHAATGNVLVRASIFQNDGMAFDRRFALTGGEDAHLFRRLSRGGYKLVWADEAVVHEHIPASRATVRWLVRRAFRTGNGMGRIDRDLDGSRAIPVIAGKGVVWMLTGGGAVVAGLLGGRATALRGFRYIAYGMGLLASLAGLRYQEYKRPVATDG